MTDVTLKEDCEATRIPSGEQVVLTKGSLMTVTQALGGSITLRDDGHLYRVGADQFSALGDLVDHLDAVQDSSIDSVEFSEEVVWAALRQCFDPEIPVNIVDLGLIYDLAIESLDGGQYQVAVKMTLTAPGCGMGPTIANDAREKIELIPAVRGAQVDIVWDPQWTPHMISDEGRKVMGLD